MATAYSYVRFSSQKQRHGASLDRQLEAAAAYAHTHSLVLDTSTYKDLGVSAFRSKNVESALGAFIEAVDSGKIAKGSYLLVEALDRLSRDTVDVALELFLSITRRGIVIVTLSDQQVYSSATIKENWTKLIVAMALMAGANEQSATKSMRAHDAIARRKARGEIVTTRLPTWMRFTEDRKAAKLIPERAAIIKEIFDRTLKGDGARALARDFKERGVPVLFYAKEWRQSAISQTIKNPAAYGEFKKVEGVLPAVVTKEKWLRANAVASARFKMGSGPKKTPSNPFAGISFCGHCQRRMRFMGGGKNHYLKCVGAHDYRDCNGRMFNFEASEAALVYELAHRSKQSVGKEMFGEQSDRREAIELESRQLKERQRKLVQLATMAERVEVVAEELRKLQGQLDALQAELKGLTAFPLSRQEAHENASLFTNYQHLLDPTFVKKGYGDAPKTLADFRQLLKVVLARTVKRVEFMNASTGWMPVMRLTYVSDKTVTVDIGKWLPERTIQQHRNGILHRSDLKKAPSTKNRSKAKQR